MTRLFTILFLLLPIFVMAQVNSSCTVPPEFEAAYKKHAQVSALESFYESGTADTILIRIPESYSEPILVALAAVYNSEYTSEVDSLYRIYCIKNEWRDYKGYRPDAMYVALDTSFAWTEAWYNEQVPSGHPLIDSLLEGIDYSVDGFIILPYVRLEFEEVINIKRLVSLLDTLEGVDFAEQTPAIGDGDDIIYHYDEVEEVAQLQFILGWGDCPSGCTSSRSWFFDVDTQFCSVDYVWAFGGGPDPFPQGTPHCLLNDVESISREYAVQLSPNPVVDRLHISSQEMITRVELFDVAGKLIYTENPKCTAFDFDLSSLSTSIYFLRVNDGKMLKVIKQ